MVRSTFPLEAKIRISPERKDARPCVVTDCLTLLREHPDDVSPAGETREALNARRLASNRRTDSFSVSIVLRLSRQTCFGACRLFVLCVNAHHSLKSPVCSCVSDSVPGRMADAARILQCLICASHREAATGSRLLTQSADGIFAARADVAQLVEQRFRNLPFCLRRRSLHSTECEQTRRLTTDNDRHSVNMASTA